MKFIKEHLTCNSYEWSLSNQTGMREMVPTRNRFDRFNGNCVLHMLNLFNKFIAHLTLQDGQQLESMIANELPLALSSELSVFNWLKGKYIYSKPFCELK
ncbi:hypothetical protein FC093_23065 [Ilyomonas limi]|uniref:Uncharacterized protein n=1 Tax=Ilyomonas limi TaxID=2575867 RepID=A0A4U3KPQ3_9BACT|nr:hypothetical protein [Ilyomonas limi]TKK64188.1 hypothetical protein FC093_23065 [Ilyomonas limi]